MRKLAIILLSLMLTVAPVYGQAIPTPTTPEPAPFTSEQLRFLEALAPALKEVASSDASTVNFIVVIAGLVLMLMMIGFVVIAVWIARGGLNTFVGMIKDANRRAEDAEDGKDKATETVERELERRRKVDEQQLETSKAQTKTLLALEQSLNSPMTRLQPVVEAINAHTDEAVKPAVENSNEAVTELKKLSEQMKSMVTQKHFDVSMAAFQKQLDNIIEKMERPPRPAPETARADGGMLSEVDAKQE